MRINKLIIVSAFIIPFVTANANASSQNDSKAETVLEDQKSAKNEAQKQRLESALQRIKEQKEKKIKALKLSKKSALKQKKSFYRSQASKAQYRFKRELNKINHNENISAKEKRKLKAKAEKKYKQITVAIEKQKIEEIKNMEELFEARIKKVKANFNKRIASIENSLLEQQK